MDANGLLMIVDGTGIPVLLRTYGEVQKPPSAVVGVLSALFLYASQFDNVNELCMLRSPNHDTVYLAVNHDLILIFISQNDFQCESTRTILRGMLFAVYKAITIIVGTNTTLTSRSTRLRATIARHTDLVDYVVTHYSCDVRLSLHQPTRMLNASIYTEKFQGLLYGVWRESDDIVCETPTQSPFCASDVALLMMYADICIDGNVTSHTAHLHTAHEEINVRFAITRLDDRTTFLGIFSMSTTLVDIQDIMRKAADIASSSNMRRIGLPPICSLPPLLASCYITVSTDINNCSSRTFYVSNPNSHHSTNASDTTKASLELQQRQSLGRFVTEHATFSMQTSNTTLDYFYELEDCTLIYSMRGPSKFYALYNAKLNLETAIEIGNTLASIFIIAQ